MKKFISLIIALLAINILPAQNVSGKLTVWSFTDELQKMLDNYFKPTHQGIQIEYSQTPSDQFQNRIDPVLFSDNGAPDVFALESAFVRKYVESGLLLDLTDIYQANKNKLLAYPVEIGTYNGRVYGLSWQACPGAMFYRRSLAKKYLGTDNPASVQRLFSNKEQFIKTAKTLKEKSGGNCRVVSSLGDLYNPFLSSRSQPWVVNGKLVIDPSMEQYMDYCKTLVENDLIGPAGQWSEEWYAGMRGELKDQSGKPLEIFAYFLPTWGLPYLLKTNAPNTSGDWAMIQGPVPYRWGGTWICAWKNTQNPNAAKELIRYLTTDNSFLERWAKDTGDLVGNVEVINKIKNNYKEPFLGGQNHYAAFADMAKNVNGKLIQGTDELIERQFNDAVWHFFYGEKTKEDALSEFRINATKSLSSEFLNRLNLILN